MSSEDIILSYLNKSEGALSNLAKDIWDHPELSLQETYASKLLIEQLEKAGFSMTKGLNQLPTGFIGSWGEGKPIIGILGEYDALPMLSQKVSTKPEPIEEGGLGHGCGHNLLGVGALGAAIAVKEAMEKNGTKGTIRYYGCPAEELGGAKAYMARDKVFHDLDAAITWHSMYLNTVWTAPTYAYNSFKLNFYGVSTHESANPETSRSALDALLLTEMAINLLHRHVIHDSYTHRNITKAGLPPQPDCGNSYAQIWYVLRAPNRDEMDKIYAKILELAKYATLMTDTTFDVEFVFGIHNYMVNNVLREVAIEKLKQIGAPKYTEEEITFAKTLQKTVAPEALESFVETYGNGLRREDMGEPLCDRIADRVVIKMQPVSTDVGSTSHVTPTVQLNTCCMPFGCGLHTWQSTASYGSSIGFKGMMLAAKAMALTALDLMVNPDHVQAARDEFVKATGGREYVSPLPEGSVPTA